MADLEYEVGILLRRPEMKNSFTIGTVVGDCVEPIHVDRLSNQASSVNSSTSSLSSYCRYSASRV